MKAIHIVRHREIDIYLESAFYLDADLGYLGADKSEMSGRSKDSTHK